MSEKAIATLFIVGMGFFGINSVLTNSAEQPLRSPEATSWESDTSTDEPDYIESDYVEDYGTEYCTEDCGGHSAGYDWAYENDVCDENFDGGNSESFAEGVRQWSEENC